MRMTDGRFFIGLFSLLLLLTGLVPAFGAGAEKNRDDSLKVRIPLAEQKKVYRVTVDRSNLRMEPLTGKMASSASGKRISERLGLPENHIVWTPVWDAVSGTGTRTRGAAVFPDNSLLVFLEETGTQPEGPFGGRLILYDLPNRRILRVLESSRRLESLIPVPSMDSVLCFARAEKRMKQPSGFVLIDLKDGRERFFRESPPVKDYTYAAGKIHLIRGTGNHLDVYDPDWKKQNAIPTGFPPERMLLSPDGGVLAVSGGSDLAFYRSATGELLGSVHLPSGDPVFRMVFLKPDSPELAVTTDGGAVGKSDLYRVTTSGVRRLASDATGLLSADPASDALFYQRFNRRQLARMDLKTGQVTAFATPQNLRPQTFGTTAHLLGSPGKDETVVIDSTGSVSVVRAVRRRLEKSLLPGIEARDNP